MTYTETVLGDAAKAVADRGVNYGTPTENHGRTAALWAAYLGCPVTAFDVCMLNILQKTSRARCDSTHRDNLVDIAGYAENAERITTPVRTPACDVKTYAGEIDRRCSLCNLLVPAQRAILVNDDDLRYDAIVWHCSCGGKMQEDSQAMALTYPRAALNRIPYLHTTPADVVPPAPAP